MPLRTTHPNEFGDPFDGQDGYLSQFFAACSVAGQAQLRELARARVVLPRTVLVAEGENLDEVGFVLSGTLAMTRVFADGQGHILGLLVPTDMYGRLFGGPSRYHIESLSNARLLCVRRTMLEALLVKEPAAERLYLTHVLDQLDLARESVLMLNGSKVISRVASFLVMLASRRLVQVQEPLHAVTLQVPLSRADLASFLGTRPETLSRALHDLDDMEVVRLLSPYEFKIINFASLLKVSGQDLAPSDLPTS